jgi:hypothetical protein
MAVIGRRTEKEIDGKADRGEVDQLREDFQREQDRRDQQHSENIQRLDAILMAVTKER